jgi:hypothetical protein
VSYAIFTTTDVNSLQIKMRITGKAVPLLNQTPHHAKEK